MYRIDNVTSAAALPTPQIVGVNPNGYFTRGNPSQGIPATILTADWANAVQEEIGGFIEASGQTLSKTDRTQFLKAFGLLQQGNANTYAASTTAANTYTATLSPVPASYTNGMRVSIKFTNHNTGVATINLNSLGAKTIKRLTGADLSANDIQDGMVGVLIYDGTNFQLQSIGNYVAQSDLLYDALVYAASTTAANTYTASLTTTPVYTTGMRVSILFTNANTGAATINLNSVGAKSIKRKNGGALQAGDIQANMMADLRYDGVNFQLMNSNDSIKTVLKQVFLASGTYTPTPGMIFCEIETVGGGAGGGSVDGSGAGTSGAASGGGAGGYAKAKYTAAQIGASQTVTIGSLGAGGSNSGANNGGVGGTTSVGSLISSTGGAAGQAATGGAAITPITGNFGGSGTVSSGTLILVMTGGCSLNGLCFGSSLAVISGKGGDSFYGHGGLSVIAGANGTNGSDYGSGGAGAASSNVATNFAGGSGTPGIVIITEYLNV